MGEAGGNKQGDVRTEQGATGWEEEPEFVFQAHQAPFTGRDVGDDISVIFGTDGLALIQQSACWKLGWSLRLRRRGLGGFGPVVLNLPNSGTLDLWPRAKGHRFTG